MWCRECNREIGSVRVPIMANMDGDIEIVDNTVEEVLSESVRKTESRVGSMYENQDKRSEKRGGEERCDGAGQSWRVCMAISK